MPPFLFTYQLDLAMHPTNIFGMQFGGKANRIAEEAAKIRDGASHHWFDWNYLPWVDDGSLFIHRAICLPLTLEAAYHRDRALSKKAREANGLPVEPDWAYFSKRC